MVERGNSAIVEPGQGTNIQITAQFVEIAIGEVDVRPFRQDTGKRDKLIAPTSQLAEKT